MRYTLLLLIAALAIGCQTEPAQVVESNWSPEQPKLIAYYEEVNGDSVKVKEEKFYEEGTTEYIGGYDENGLRHGEWRYFYKDGTLWSLGVYEHGVMNGKKEVYWPDGTLRYEGYFLNNEKSGHWVFYKADGSILQEMDY